MSGRSRQPAWTVRNFYRFVDLSDNKSRRARLEQLCAEAGVVGSILLAPEGINGSLAGRCAAELDQALAGIAADPAFAGLKWRESYSDIDRSPFRRLKVLCKEQILKFAPPLPAGESAARVTAQDWMRLIQKGEVLLVDVRNSYETEIGGFPGAITMDTDSFAEFPEAAKRLLPPPAEAPPLGLYCTGGIRCEKAGAWLRGQNYRELFQLDGGILEFFRQTPEAESFWQGDCFVFDDRLRVSPELFETSAQPGQDS